MYQLDKAGGQLCLLDSNDLQDKVRHLLRKQYKLSLAYNQN